MDAIGTNPVRLGNRTYRPGIYRVFLLKLTLMVCKYFVPICLNRGLYGLRGERGERGRGFWAFQVFFTSCRDFRKPLFFCVFRVLRAFRDSDKMRTGKPSPYENPSFSV